MTKMTSL